MIGDFARILPFTLRWEAGNVDDPADRGGRTSRGITQRTYDGACTLYGWPDGDVWRATDEQVETIYQRRFWNRIAGDELGWPLCGALFDTVVLHRLEPIVERLQAAIGARIDGQLGPETVARARTMGWVNSAWLFLQARDDRYEDVVHRDGTQRKFYRGWEARLDALTQFLELPKTLDPAA